MDERGLVRELAKKYHEIANEPVQNTRRSLWRDHYDLVDTRPLLYTNYFNPSELFSVFPPECENEFYRSWEMEFRKQLFYASLSHDQVVNPWVTITAVKENDNEMRWGLPVEMSGKTHEGGAAAFKPSLNNEEDFEKLKVPYHRIDEKATRERHDKVYDLIGDILPVHIDRDPAYKVWSGDISTDIVKLRGLEQFMLDMYDRPDWLHKLLAFMRDGILKTHDEAEKAGDLSSASQCIKLQGQAFSSHTAEPKPLDYGKKRSDLFIYIAAQEMTSVSGEMFNEFMLQYQIPIIEKYRYVLYGCCEDMTNKIKYLKNIKNMRQIAITPFSDTGKCAEQIGSEYVTSWRPNPSLIICNGVDEDFVRKHMRENFKIFKKHKNKVNINLKDIYTFKKDPDNLVRVNRIIMEEIERGF